MATAQYDRDNTTRFNLKLNNNTDAEIIAKLKSVKSTQGYIKYLVQNDIEEENEMKNISIDNGISTVTPAEALSKIPFDVIVNYMDDDAREHVHAMIAPCTELEFLTRYLKVAKDDLIIG